MELKKILALAMMVLLALPSLTMVVRADDPVDGVGLASAIERARTYLNDVRTSAEDLALEYDTSEDVLGYLDEIYDLIGQDGGEAPDFLLKSGTYGIAELSDFESYRGTYSVHLETTGTTGDGDEARIVIPMPSRFTLEQLDSISWWEFLEYGYPPHVDVILDMGDDTTDALVFEYAYNYESHAAETWPTYDALTGAWYQTFSDDGNGPSEITGDSRAWLSSGAPGPLTGADDFYYHNLRYWISTGDRGITGETRVLRLEIEVDNWIAQTKAYVDDIEINGVLYDFEEEEEYGKVMYYLDQASAYLEDKEFNLAARSLASARNILGRVKGLLNSMIKAQKVTRIDWFMAQMRIRINGILDKVDKLSGRLDESEANNVRAAMGNAWGNIPHMGDNPSDDDVIVVMDGLEATTEIIDAGMDEVDEDTSTLLEAMDRLEAKIRVLKASADRLERKGADTFGIEEELENAEAMLEEIIGLHADGKTDEAEVLLEEANNLVSDAGSNIQGLRNQSKGKGNKDSKPGKKNK